MGNCCSDEQVHSKNGEFYALRDEPSRPAKEESYTANFQNTNNRVKANMMTSNLDNSDKLNASFEFKHHKKFKGGIHKANTEKTVHLS